MFRVLLSVCCIILIVPLILLSCAEDDNTKDNAFGNGSWENQIIDVIYKWQKSYEGKDFGSYRTVFWEDDFEHRFILDGKVIGIFYSFSEEEKYTQNVFKKFDEIVMELTINREKWPKSKSSTEAEVEAKYKIQFTDEKETNDSDQCPYKGYYAEGKITFTFLKKESSGKEEWRIIRLIDEALSEEEIRGKYKVEIIE